MKIKSKTTEEPDRTEVTEIYRGTQEDMDKARKERLPEMIESIQDMFEDWDGSGVVILKSFTKKSGKQGIKMMITGVSEPLDMLELAYRCHTARNEIVATIKDSIPVESFIVNVLKLAKMHDINLADILHD